MAKKKAKVQKHAGIWPAVFAGIFSVGLGLVLGFAARAADPAVEGKMPKEPEKGQVYYEKGSLAASTGWEAVEEQLLTGSSEPITITEGQLNAWAQNTFKKAKTPEGDKEEKAAPVMLIPGTPSFQISEGKLQITLMLEGGFFGNEFDRRAIFTGRVVNNKFVIETATYGCAKLPPGMSNALSQSLKSAFTAHEKVEKLANALAGMSSISVQEESLLLTP